MLWLKDESMTPGQQITTIRVIATLLSAADLDGEYVEVTNTGLTTSSSKNEGLRPQPALRKLPHVSELNPRKWGNCTHGI